MLLRDTFITAFKGVTKNLGRSLLTMLGIIIGVGSVVLMTSIGGSVQHLILGQVSSLGARSMIVVPGNDQSGGNPAIGQIDSLKFGDIEALEHLSTIRSVAPVILVTGKVIYGREEAQPQVFGTTGNFFRNQSIPLDRGRLLDHGDEQGAASVAVIGPDTAEDLFGAADPLGKRMQIADHAFTVVGVLQPLGTQFFQNVDERIYIPFSLARVLTGRKYVNSVTLQAAESVDLAAADITSLLRARHRIDNPTDDKAKDDFHVHSAEQATSILGTVSLALTLFMTTIAAISLVVGG
ncbi:MAG: putative ABC transport system permease protein, partial [Candidatus Peregrinibacteria bacterium Greene0416_19]